MDNKYYALAMQQVTIDPIDLHLILISKTLIESDHHCILDCECVPDNPQSPLMPHTYIRPTDTVAQRTPYYCTANIMKPLVTRITTEQSIYSTDLIKHDMFSSDI